MKRFFPFLVCLLSLVEVFAQGKPKLVVGIVVDQMRFDYLHKYSRKYGSDGFSRLLNEGFLCKNAHFNSMPTHTGPGHATVYTGTTGAIHGIVANGWFDKATGSVVYCAADDSVQTVGTIAPTGKMSPKKLLVSTLGDELKMASLGQAKVVGIGLKDRSAIFPAGHAADAALWFDPATGNWISSTYYADTLPQWAQAYNAKKLPDQYLTKSWETLYPLAEYTEALPDDSPFEYPFRGLQKPTFPYQLDTLAPLNLGYGILRNTPFGMTMTTDLALEALKGMQMGADNSTDLLAISYSSPDIVGHQCGINSVEMMDMYLRLDLEIARLLKELDVQVGKGNYTVFLTADHGAIEVPNMLKESKIPAGTVNSPTINTELNKALQDRFKSENLVMAYVNEQVYLDYDEIEKQKLNPTEIEQWIIHFFLKKDYVHSVMPTRELLSGNFEGHPLQLAKRGIHQTRSGDIMVIYKPGFLAYGSKGTSHGSAFVSDTHVPVLFFGAGIHQGSTVDRVVIPDIAPTITTLLNLQQPDGCSGNPIKKVFEN